MAVVVASRNITAAAAVEVEIIKSDDTTIEIITIEGSPTEIGVIGREILLIEVEATSKEEGGAAALVAGEEGTNAGIAAIGEGEVEAII